MGACPRLGGKHEAAVAVMINMTVFEVMVGRWVVNLEQEEKDTVVFLVGPRQKAYQNLGVALRAEFLWLFPLVVERNDGASPEWMFLPP